MESVFLKATAIVIPLAMIFGIVSICTISWLEERSVVGGETVHYGLFRLCAWAKVSGSEYYECKKLPLDYTPGWLLEVQGLTVSHVVLQFLASIPFFSGFKQGNKMVAYTGCIMIVIAGILLVAGNAVFTAKAPHEPKFSGYSYGYSFYLSWAATVFAFIAPFCAFKAFSAIESTASIGVFR